MRAKDKLEEAKFFLKNLRRSKTRTAFRRNLSAFITAWRSVTLVLQKDYRSRFGDKFDQWYAAATHDLKSLPHAKALLELRNIVQKEGNRLPIWEYEYYDPADDKLKLIFQYDPSSDGIPRFEISPESLGVESIHLPQPMSPEEIHSYLREVILPEVVEPKVMELSEKLSSRKDALAITTRGLVIDDDGTVMTKDEFLDVLQTHVERLNLLLEEAKSMFEK